MDQNGEKIHFLLFGCTALYVFYAICGFVLISLLLSGSVILVVFFLYSSIIQAIFLSFSTVPFLTVHLLSYFLSASFLNILSGHIRVICSVINFAFSLTALF